MGIIHEHEHEYYTFHGTTSPNCNNESNPILQVQWVSRFKISNPLTFICVIEVHTKKKLVFCIEKNLSVHEKY